MLLGVPFHSGSVIIEEEVRNFGWKDVRTETKQGYKLPQETEWEWGVVFAPLHNNSILTFYVNISAAEQLRVWAEAGKQVLMSRNLSVIESDLTFCLFVMFVLFFVCFLIQGSGPKCLRNSFFFIAVNYNPPHLSQFLYTPLRCFCLLQFIYYYTTLKLKLYIIHINMKPTNMLVKSV